MQFVVSLHRICPFLDSIEGGVRSVIDVTRFGEDAALPIPSMTPYILLPVKVIFFFGRIFSGWHPALHGS